MVEVQRSIQKKSVLDVITDIGGSMGPELHRIVDRKGKIEGRNADMQKPQILSPQCVKSVCRDKSYCCDKIAYVGA